MERAKTGLFIAGVGTALVAAQTALLIGFGEVNEDFKHGSLWNPNLWSQTAGVILGADACIGLPLLCAWDAAKRGHI